MAAGGAPEFDSPAGKAASGNPAEPLRLRGLPTGEGKEEIWVGRIRTNGEAVYLYNGWMDGWSSIQRFGTNLKGALHNGLCSYTYGTYTVVYVRYLY